MYVILLVNVLHDFDAIKVMMMMSLGTLGEKTVSVNRAATRGQAHCLDY